MSLDEKGIAHRPRQTIGDVLRRARQEHGGEIEAIAKALRIRADYIAAIEQARYDRLPGVVYAIGFVRTYAIHLGLDGEEAVRRFKLEAAGRLDGRRDLSFPMPLSQRAVPGGRMLLAAFILAVCFYGAWYYLSTGDRALQERVAAVPTSLLPATNSTPAPANAASSDSSSAFAAPALPPIRDAEAAPVAPADGGSNAASAPVAAPVVTPAPVLAAVTPSSLPAPPPAAVVAPAVAAPSVTPPVATAPTVVTPTPTPLPTPAPVAMAPADTAAVTPPPTPAAVPVSAPVPPGPRTYGAINAPSRIVLHAVKDCWIQVNDENDRVIAQRILHPGDIYRVPDHAGLILRTGNGSGLEISVDDRPAPGFGGTVHRNILLDPARVAAGTAIN